MKSSLSIISEWGAELGLAQILNEYSESVVCMNTSFSDLSAQMSAPSPQTGDWGLKKKIKKMWQGQLLWRVDYLMRGNQLECYSPLWTFIHLAWPLLNFYDGLWLFSGREISVNGDCSALLQMYYLPYSMNDTSSNQREPCGLLIDGLYVGFEGGKKRWGRRLRGERGWSAGGGWGVTDVQHFERKLNKYLISQRSSAPWRWPLSQAF